MRFPPSFLDEIRARVPVSTIVGRRVKLKKQGREWRGLSPFNAEKTPSFFVNDQKMAWFDFSSGKNGNIFDFMMLTEGLSFPEAVERLAGEAGLPLPRTSPDAQRREEERKTLFDVIELAAAFYESNLQTRSGARARGYLADRDIRPETQTKFRIGYAPNERFALRDHLAAKGISRDDMIAAGLLVHGEDIPVPYDRFRERVIFPIHDMRGHVIAFGARALEKDVPAKYLNSPETVLFHKGSVVFNSHRARKAAHETGRLVVVEGYVDVVMLAQAGIDEAIAPLGTALTEDQLDLAWRMVEEPILCFDGDKAGQRAAHRAIDLALPKVGPGRSIRFAFLPSGFDPDDLIRRRGRGAMEEVLAAARPLAEVLWDREIGAGSTDTPERRAALETRLKGLTQQITDATVRRHYEEELRIRFRRLSASAAAGALPPPSQRGRFARGVGPRGQGKEPLAVSESLRRSALIRGRASDWPLREALLVATAANHPRLLDRHTEAFAGLELDDPELRRLRDAILEVATMDLGRDPSSVAEGLMRRGLNLAHKRLESFVERSGLWFVQRSAALEDVEVSWLQMAALHHRARTLNKDLKVAEIAFGLDPSEDNNSRLCAIRRELLTNHGTEALIEGYGVSSGRAPRAG
jgi:DNA primase